MTIKSTFTHIIDKVAHREPATVRVLRDDAERGLAHAQTALGDIYRKGSLVPKDLAVAAKWYRLAAVQGDAHAQFSLGALLLAGDGMPADDAEALMWFRLAAAQGDALAQFNLGTMYWNGRGVAQDNVQACMWFELSASRGTQTAAAHLDRIMQMMTPIQIIDARELAREWKPVKGPAT
jgi:TPR repeat protein